MVMPELGFNSSRHSEAPLSTAPGEVTQILHEFRKGNFQAQDRLVPLVYRELQRIADAHMRRESMTNSLQPTALVHEAYLRLVDISQIDWRDRAHFFAVAST